ncbi:MAG: hypothetical protein GKS02_00855 [Alphaproteobacteria bacterium]|nr:hypothetical protein [Alphaproteobacteria bacterium]
MTAILGMLYRDTPCLLGDMMISSPNPPEREVSLPVSGQVSAEMPIRWDTRYFTDFRQKLNLIGPNLIVAWSGSLVEAQAAISHLRNGYASVDPSSFDQILELTESITELELKNTILIVLIANSERWLLRHVGAARTIQTPWGENAVVAGVGEDHIIDALESEFEFNNEDRFSQAIGNLLMASSRMWFWDINGVGPNLAFGGGYEVAIRQNNQISKIGDILYANHVYVPGRGIALVPIFKKVDYYQDNLIVRVLGFSAPPKKASDDFDYHRKAIYVIPPVDRIWSCSCPAPSMEEVLDNIPDFNASHFASYVEIPSTKSNVRPHSVAMHEYRTEDRPIKFEYEPGGQFPRSLNLEERYINQVRDQVLQVVAEAGETI